MAKATSKKTAKPATRPIKPARPSAAKTIKVVKAAAPAKKPAPVKVAPVSKDELRAQLEKAQNTIATLRTKSREAVRAAKASAAQIVELEEKVAQLETKLAAQTKPAKPVPAVVKPAIPRGRMAAVKADVVVPAAAADSVPADTDTTTED